MLRSWCCVAASDGTLCPGRLAQSLGAGLGCSEGGLGALGDHPALSALRHSAMMPTTISLASGMSAHESERPPSSGQAVTEPSHENRVSGVNPFAPSINVGLQCKSRLSF
jgi:hypothetical protein